MIEANQLRLGNYLQWDNAYYKVKYVGETIGLDISDTNGEGATQKFQHNPVYSHNINELQPVPLTPELLEKAGFEYERATWGDKKCIAFFTDDVTDKGMYCYLGVWNYIDDQKGIGYVKYLHSLQNLYYALTGEELEVNLLNPSPR
jgi:hypothetical protein